MPAPLDDRGSEHHKARRREPACLVILDGDYHIASAEARLAEMLSEAGLDWPVQTRLPQTLEAALRGSACEAGDHGDRVVFVAPFMLRAVELSGPGGSCLALSVERTRSRNPMASAAARYRLTAREVQVLGGILEGKSAQAIGEELGVARSTVHEHFKHLGAKIGARNRADLVARTLDWVPADPDTAV